MFNGSLDVRPNGLDDLTTALGWRERIASTNSVHRADQDKTRELDDAKTSEVAYWRARWETLTNEKFREQLKGTYVSLVDWQPGLAGRRAAGELSDEELIEQHAPPKPPKC